MSATRLQGSIPPCRHTCSTPLDLHTSISLRLRRTYRPPCLNVSTSLRLQRTSFATYLHIGTPAARLQHSIPPRLHAYSAAPDPELHASTSARLHLHASIPPRRET